MEKELMLKIVERALEINSRQKNTIFINYFGHVDSLEYKYIQKAGKKVRNQIIQRMYIWEFNHRKMTKKNYKKY